MIYFQSEESFHTAVMSEAPSSYNLANLTALSTAQLPKPQMESTLSEESLRRHNEGQFPSVSFNLCSSSQVLYHIKVNEITKNMEAFVTKRSPLVDFNEKPWRLQNIIMKVIKMKSVRIAFGQVV